MNERLARLLEHPERIPKDWPDIVFFRDTLHSGSCGNPCIEYARRDSDGWRAGVMDTSWCGHVPRALLLETVPELTLVPHP